MRYLPDQFEHSTLLLVEGHDEVRLLEALFRYRGRTGIQIVRIEGKDDVGSFLRAIVRINGFGRVRRLGIVQDADNDAGSSFRRICTALESAKLAVPDDAWVLAGQHVETIVGILPDGSAPGDLETLVLMALARDTAVECVTAYFDCLDRAGRVWPRQLSKARLHAYLASLEPPHLRLGEAAERGLLPLDNPVFDRLIGLLP